MEINQEALQCSVNLTGYVLYISLVNFYLIFYYENNEAKRVKSFANFLANY